MIKIVDSALGAIHAALGEHDPEQGGAIFGPPGLPIISSFIHDDTASTTRSVYHSTDALMAQILDRELATAERFKGIIHSHPHGMPYPSGQDRTEYAKTLASNADLGSYLAPIVTHDSITELEPHELRFEGARYSFFSAHRSSKTQAMLIPEPISVIPFGASWTSIGDRALGSLLYLPVAGEPMMAGEVVLPGMGEAMLLIPFSFPNGPPLLVSGKDNSSIPLEWDLSIAAECRLEVALGKLEVRRSRSPSVNRVAHSLSSSEPSGATDEWIEEEDLFARSAGLVSESLRGKHVLVVGTGSVGSYLAELLSRAGVGSLTLVDPDKVEKHNVARSLFGVSDIGQPKVDVVARRIRTALGTTTVQPVIGTLDDLPDSELRALMESVDLVLGLTDSNRAQLELAQFAYWHRRRGIFAGLYAKAAAGEVVISDPRGPCWSCSLGGARKVEAIAESPRRSTDYGTGRLVAEPGLLADIHHVSTMALKLALGALEDDPSTEVYRLYRRAVHENRTFLQTTMTGDSALVEAVFGPIPGQLAYQSVWLASLERDEDCPICGALVGRSDPYEFRSRPSLDSLRSRHEESRTTDDLSAESPLETHGTLTAVSRPVGRATDQDPDTSDVVASSSLRAHPRFKDARRFRWGTAWSSLKILIRSDSDRPPVD